MEWFETRTGLDKKREKSYNNILVYCGGIRVWKCVTIGINQRYRRAENHGKTAQVEDAKDVAARY